MVLGFREFVWEVFFYFALGRFAGLESGCDEGYWFRVDLFVRIYLDESKY